MPTVYVWLLVVLLLASAVFVFVNVKATEVSAPGASGPYGFEVASAAKPLGTLSVTSPVWGTDDQLWTSTARGIVSPTAIEAAAGDRPTRPASGTRCVTH